MSDLSLENLSESVADEGHGNASGGMKLPISWQIDGVGVVGITLLVVVLMWPVFSGSHVLMSDSWTLNYPWAVEGSVEEAEFERAYPELGTASSSIGEESRGLEGAVERDEPYVLEYDIYLECIPWYEFAQGEIRAGRFPHWNPYAFCGAPFYANHLVPLTHPPLLVALVLAPADYVHTVATFLTWWLAGIGLYFYLRSKGLHPTAGIGAAAIYLGIGHYMPLVPFQMAGLMYYPWLLWTSDILDERRSIRAMLPFSILLGLQLAAGHPAYVAPFFYLLLLHRILHWIFRREVARVWGPKLGVLLVAILFGFMISAVQNLPTWNFLKLSARDMSGQTDRSLYNDEGAGGVGLINQGDVDGRSIFEKLSVLLVPVFQREIEKQHPNVGIPLLLLAILGLLYIRPPPDRWAMGVLLLIFAVLAVPGIFTRVAQFIPGLGLSPFNPYAPAQFLLVILAGYGLDGLLHGNFKLAILWKVLITVLSVIGLVIFAWIMFDKAVLEPSTRWAIDSVSLAVILLVIGMLSIVIVPSALISGRRSMILGAVFVPLLITVGSILGHFYQYPVFQRLPVMPVTESIAALPETSMYRVIRHSSKLATHAGSVDNPLTFGGNLPMWAGMLDSQGYDSFVLEGQWILLKGLDQGSLAWNGLALPVTDPNALDSDILDWMAVKYVISDDPDLGDEYPNLLPIHSGGMQVYERVNSAPRWYLSDQFQSGYGEDDYVSMRELRINYPAADLNSINLESGSISLVRETPSRIEFQVDAVRECRMVLADTWHPQWVARLDGVEVEVLRVNGAYRTVEITSGEHDLVFEYMPRDFYKGLIISVLSIFLLIAGGIVESIRNRTIKPY